MKSQISPLLFNIISQDLSKLDLTTNIKLELGSKGYGLIFNNNSNISLIPYYLFDQIVTHYRSFEDVIVGPINTQDEYQELIIYAYIKDYEYLHFILENMDISIPLKYYLTAKKEESQKYGMRFFSRKDQEYIVFGKDLIDIMEIEFKGQNNFTIHNSEFISTFGDNE